ncbi:hypothetical protein GAMM_60102 [Gammaproteobacteria bacterium]
MRDLTNSEMNVVSGGTIGDKVLSLYKDAKAANAAFALYKDCIAAITAKSVNSSHNDL